MNKCLEEMLVKLKDCWSRLNKLSKTNLAAAVAAAEEDGEEDPVLYGCQVALMRLYHLQTGSSKHLGGVADLEKGLEKILQVELEPLLPCALLLPLLSLVTLSPPSSPFPLVATVPSLPPLLLWKKRSDSLLECRPQGSPKARASPRGSSSMRS